MSASEPHSPAEPADGWPSASAGGFDAQDAWGWTPRRRRLVRPIDLLVGVLTTVAVAVLGLPVGALWAAIAPRVFGYAQGNLVFLVDPESSAPIARDGTFALVSVLVGLVCGLLAFLLIRGYGPAAACGVVVGGVLAAVVAWQAGRHLFGPADLAHLTPRPPDGTRFALPLNVGADGVLLAWPIGAAFMFFVLTTVTHVTRRAAVRRAAGELDPSAFGATRYLPADQPPQH